MENSEEKQELVYQKVTVVSLFREEGRCHGLEEAPGGLFLYLNLGCGCTAVGFIIGYEDDIKVFSMFVI